MTAEDFEPCRLERCRRGDSLHPAHPPQKRWNPVDGICVDCGKPFEPVTHGFDGRPLRRRTVRCNRCRQTIRLRARKRAREKKIKGVRRCLYCGEFGHYRKGCDKRAEAIARAHKRGEKFKDPIPVRLYSVPSKRRRA